MRMWAGWAMGLEGEDSKHLLGLKCHCDLWQRGFWPVEQEGGLSVKSSRGQVRGAGRVDGQNGTVASEREGNRRCWNWRNWCNCRDGDYAGVEDACTRKAGQAGERGTLMMETFKARPLPASREGLVSDLEEFMGLFALLLAMVEEEEIDDVDLRRVGMMRTMTG